MADCPAGKVRGRCSTQTLSCASTAMLDASPNFHFAGTLGQDGSTSNTGTAAAPAIPMNAAIRNAPLRMLDVMLQPLRESILRHPRALRLRDNEGRWPPLQTSTSPMWVSPHVSGAACAPPSRSPMKKTVSASPRERRIPRYWRSSPSSPPSLPCWCKPMPTPSRVLSLACSTMSSRPAPKTLCVTCSLSKEAGLPLFWWVRSCLPCGPVPA